MKKKISRNKLLWIWAASFSLSAAASAQTVTIANLDGKTGDVYIGWYTQPETFRINNKSVFRQKVRVNGHSRISVDFKEIPYGRYAIAVFLDENDNYKLDRNFLGIPSEKYGFSNNVRHAFRPASFEEASFRLKDNKEPILISLK